MGEIKCEKCSKSISVEIVNSMTAKASSSTDLESSTRIQDRHFCAECIQSVSHGDGIQVSALHSSFVFFHSNFPQKNKF